MEILGSKIKLNDFLFLIFSMLLLMTPLFDAVSVFSRHFDLFDLSRVSIIVRALMLFVASVGIILSKRANMYLIVLSVIVLLPNSYMWMAYTFKSDFNYSLSDVIETGIYSLKLTYFFVVFYFLDLTVRDNIYNLDRIVRWSTAIILLYCFFIIVGGLGNYDVFKSYGESGRWGVKGIVIAGNEVSGFLLVSLTLCMLGVGYLSNKISLFFILVCLILSGTKASYIAMIMMCLGYLYALYSFEKFIVNILIFSIFCFLSIYMVYSYIPQVKDAVHETISYFSYQFDNVTNGSWIRLFLSGRDYLLVKIYNEIVGYSPLVFIFGGYPISNQYVEMDLFDLIPLIGVPSTIVYVVFWFRIWMVGHLNRKIKNIKFMFLIVFLFLAIFAGHLLYSAMIAPYLAVLAIWLKYNKSSAVADV